MYRGLVKSTVRRIPVATRQVKYGLKDKVHSVTISGMGQAEYAGPLQPGQTWKQYQSYMTAQNVVIGSGIAALAFVNPIIGGVALVGWLLTPGLASKSQPKSPTQGG